MRQLFLFIYTYRAFFVFLVFEGLSGFLVIQNQNYHSAAFFNSSGAVIGSINSSVSNTKEYFNLREQNEELSREIARLNELLQTMETTAEAPNLPDVEPNYDFMSAKVVNNSFRQLNNYLTINKGKSDSIEADMGVIGPDGIVGKVRSASDHFAIVVSLLHTDFMVSSKLKRSGDLCTTNWDGRDPMFSNVLFVPKHVFVTFGDTVVTSGYNSIFPEGQLIGVVEEVLTQPNATFHEIRMRLSTDFSNLNYVSVVSHVQAVEKDSLEQQAEIIN
ncbi:MAG: rod shape-determining protein MreC [Cyclobacteriaceae bacterium]